MDEGRWLDTTEDRSRRLVLAGALVLGLAVLYRDLVWELIRAWGTDNRYSHGYLIPPIAGYLVWQRRHGFSAAPLHPNGFGLVIIAASVVLMVGMGAESFLARMSLVGALAGVVLFCFGWSRLRLLIFPLAVLLLMIPVPVTILNQIEFPLQIGASQFAETVIRAVHIPVAREGNVLMLSNISLEVAEECSGVRSLISLLTLGIVFGYGPDSRSWARLLVAALAIPVVVLTNGTRVAVTAVAAHYYGSAAATGFFHDLCGWLAFAAAFAMMVLLHRLLLSVSPGRTASPTTPAAAPAG
jgi:exosortase